MHVNLFAYGTIRTDPKLSSVMEFSDAELSDYGQLDIQLNWDPQAELIGKLGGWKLHDRTMFCDHNKLGNGVPAVSNWKTDGYVIGDLYRLTIDGFREILRYEGWPSLYDYEVLHVVSTGPKVAMIEQAVVFTTSRADQFGEAVPHGDYFAHDHKEVQCAE